MSFRVLDIIALILVLLGGINLGFVGLFNIDIIVDLFSDYLIIAHTLFFLIGIAAIYLCFRFGQVLNQLLPKSNV